MKLTSSAFEEGDTIPLRYTKEGEDVSPPLEWCEVPENAREFALIFETIISRSKELFVQWLLYKIPADVSSLPEGFKHQREPESPLAGVMQGKNSIGNVGYDGPLGTAGRKMRYQFTLYALDRPLDAAAGIEKRYLCQAMGAHVVAEATLGVVYKRPRPTEVAKR